MSECLTEDPTALITPRLCGSSAKVPPLVRLVLVAPTTPAEAFKIDLVITAALTHPPAKRVKALAGI